MSRSALQASSDRSQLPLCSAGCFKGLGVVGCSSSPPPASSSLCSVCSADASLCSVCSAVASLGSFLLVGMAWRGQRGQGKGWPGGAKGDKERGGMAWRGQRDQGKGWPGGAKGGREREGQEGPDVVFDVMSNLRECSYV